MSDMRAVLISISLQCRVSFRVDFKTERVIVSTPSKMKLLRSGFISILYSIGTIDFDSLTFLLLLVIFLFFIGKCYHITMERDTFTVKCSSFEGPFGLLLDLVEKRKLFINDLSLAAVTEDYLEYMNRQGGFKSLSPSEISSFVVVASTLLLIKSKSLLPNLSLTEEEESDIKNLEERLRLYELFARLGLNIKNNFGEQIIFPAEERKNRILVFLPDREITKESMMGFAKNVLGALPKKDFLPEVEVRKVVSIEEMIENLTERIKSAVKMSFRDLHGKVVTREQKVVAIVGFLALLELIRQGMVDAVQEMDKGDIIIEKQETT